MIHDPGIYFGMPEEEYHADHSFSTSGAKKILISPLDYWMDSWRNPNRKHRDTAALRLGRAHHTLILEGQEAFDRRFAVAPSQADYPDALMKGDDMRAFLREHGAKTNGTNAELAERIASINPDVECWNTIQERFEAKAGNKLILRGEQAEALDSARFVINRMPSVKDVFKEGYPEGSIFWVEDGVPMKSRVDYMRQQAMVDLKSFSNSMGKPIEAAIAADVARYLYYVQAVIYLKGLRATRALARQDRSTVHGEVDAEWLDRFLGSNSLRFFFVFIQTGGVPNCLIREFCERDPDGANGASLNGYWMTGEAAYRRALEQYQRCMREFGDELPWIVDYGRGTFRDTDFPVWMGERIAA